MNIFIFTPRPEIFTNTLKLFHENKITCTINENTDSLFEILYNYEKLPDLFVLDYYSYNFTDFNFYTFLHEIKKPLPVIFYNDPFPAREDICTYWLAKCRFYGLIDDEVTYMSIFRIILTTLKTEPTHTDLFLSQPSYSINSISDARENFSEISTGLNLPPALYTVLKYLFETNDFISIEEMKKHLLISGIEASESTVYAYISRLRKKLQQSERYNITIINNLKKYKLLVY